MLDRITVPMKPPQECRSRGMLPVSRHRVSRASKQEPRLTVETSHTFPRRRDSRTDVKRFVIQIGAKRSTRDIFPGIGSSHLVHVYFCYTTRLYAEPADALHRSNVNSHCRLHCRSIDPIGRRVERRTPNKGTSCSVGRSPWNWGKRPLSSCYIRGCL